MLNKRRLMLLRHAKSARPYGVLDRERPLARRGRRAASDIGAYMMREGLVPDLILVSPARRALETLKLVRDWLPGNIPCRQSAGVYGASGLGILEVIREIRSDALTLLIIGHNPGMASAASLIIAGGEPKAVKDMREKFPTAGLAVIELALGWNDVVEGSGYLEHLITPKALALVALHADRMGGEAAATLGRRSHPRVARHELIWLASFHGPLPNPDHTGLPSHSLTPASQHWS